MIEKPFSFAALIALIVGFVLVFVLVAVLIFKPAALLRLFSPDTSPTVVAVPTTVVPPTAVSPATTTVIASATQPDPATATATLIGVTPAVTDTTAPVDTATPTSAPTGLRVSSPTPSLPGPDRAEFVEDVTVPDGTPFAEGAEFIKTWRIKNVGTTTWTTAYIFEFAGGTPMALVTRMALPNSVAPGETIDLSIPMKVPTGLGKQTSLFQLRNASGSKFGVGPQYNEFIYVEIVVVAGEASATSTTP